MCNLKDLTERALVRLRNEPAIVKGLVRPLAVALSLYALKLGVNIPADLIVLAVFSVLGISVAQVRGIVWTPDSVSQAAEKAEADGFASGWDWAEATRHSDEPEAGPAPCL